MGIREVISQTFVDVDGFGWVAGADEDIISAAEGGPGAVLFGTGADVDPGESFDLVFLSYDAAPATNGSLEYVVGLALAPNDVGIALVVPEPGAGLTALAGAALLAARRRVSGRSRAGT